LHRFLRVDNDYLRLSEVEKPITASVTLPAIFVENIFPMRRELKDPKIPQRKDGGVPPINTPVDAVRAFTVAEAQKNKGDDMGQGSQMQPRRSYCVQLNSGPPESELAFRILFLNRGSLRFFRLR
jgi:hypothetical protein